MPKITGGYVLQPRIFDGSEASKMSPVTRELWFYLLRNVNHADNGKFKRGQRFFQFSEIQEALHWYVGYRKMIYSKPQLTKALRRLNEGNMTATAKATRGIVITILNYDVYQDPKNYEGNGEGSTKEQRRNFGGHTINKNDKNERMKELKRKDTKKKSLIPYLQEKIIENNLIETKDKIFEFYNYRNTNFTKKDHYNTDLKINGLFRHVVGCRKAGLIISECLDIAMESGWKTPNPEYFRNNKPHNNKSVSEINQAAGDSWLAKRKAARAAGRIK